MESLRGLPEHIEGDFGDSIVARDEAVAVLGTSPGLGPPDLCWLQKCPKRTGLFGSSGEAQGYYHYVLGRDVSSSAAVAAYFALLNSRVEPRTMLQGLWMSPDHVIERGFYCCYDPISRLDVRCELCVPGGVVVGCVDAAGQLHDATPQLWMQAQVMAFVRAVLYDPEMRLNGGSVIAYDPCPSSSSEVALLSSILELYSRGALPGGLQDIAEDQGFGVVAEQMDVVLAAVWQHFRRRQRWEAAADFFRELMQVHSPATLLLAAAERAQGLSTGGAVLSELLARPASSSSVNSSHVLVPATMVGLGHELLQQGESDAAASLARRALAVCPRCRPAWLLLAKCFVAERQYGAALVALNVVPTPPLPAAEVELLHVVPPPAPKSTTQPQVRLYDGELEASRWCALEEASLDGSRLLAYLPGSILVNREPLGAAYHPDVCPNRITRSVLTAVYDLLQAIVNDISWDRFLEVRSRVFLMQHEVAQSPQHNGVRHSTSSEIQPEQHPQQQQPSGQPPLPSQGLAALHAAQQEALMRKLEQLGLTASPSDSPSGSPDAAAAHQATQYPLAILTGGSGSTPAAAAAGSPGLAAVPGSAGRTPPASRGRLSSGGGANHRGGSPQSYYASRLQEELLLSRPVAAPGSRGGSRGGSGGRAAGGQATLNEQQQQSGAGLGRQQHPQQEPEHTQQPQQQRAGSPDSVQSPGSASSATAPAAPHVPGTPGSGQRSMAGRVLLLGKKTQPRSDGSSRPAVPRAVAPLGCGVPRSLAPNEVEDLSKYATASHVVPLRVPASAGVMPELWNTVFGGLNSSNQPQPPAAAGPAGAAAAAPALGLEPAPSVAESDDSLSAAAAGLPRIRTRPLGEAVEQCERLPPCCSPGGAAVRGSAPARHAAHLYHSSKHSLLPCGSHSLAPADWHSANNSDSAGAAAQLHSRQQPLGEGLDRTASLLTRSTSNASAAAGGSGSQALPHVSSLRQGGSLVTSGAMHSAGSGGLGSARSRRLSLVGETANRSLEADREGLIKGWLHDDISAQSGWSGTEDVSSPIGPTGSRRRLCVRWLDELIVALWHDLQAHMEWKVVDQTLRETRGGTAAELVLGMAPATIAGTPTSAGSAHVTPTAAGGGGSDGGAFEPPVLTSSDWMRRGALAERLGHTLDARAAYRAAVKLSFNLTSYLALMRLEADAESISNTGLCAAQVLGWHQQRAGLLGSGSSGTQAEGQGASGSGGTSSSSSASTAAGTSGGMVLLGVPPAEVVWAMGVVTDSTSLQEVRNGMADAAPAARAMLRAVVDEWQRWQEVKLRPALAARRLAA